MLFNSPEKVDLADEEFRLLSTFIYEYCGLHFDESNRFLLESRLQKRLRTYHFDSFLKYYHYLLFHQDRVQEINELLNVITTNETYFFREQNQLDAFSNEVLPYIAQQKARRRQLRIWSAGCSTGEEPYTIAILLKESGLFEGWNVDIIGTDISQQVLKSARKAEYSSSSFRTTDSSRIQRYFKTSENGKQILYDSIRTMVHFGHHNLLDEKMLGLIGECDLIMCRNVIIYFDRDAKAKVISAFHRKLVPGGYLFLGHSESLMNISTAFKLKHLSRVMVYQKPGDDG
ncbi:MAG: protein-glutamate O-methyltransferase CheR [Deltaproteobacteria bacterium]|nr:protein-glutamate O-methyltransferase CheR [Deltaproteobacteria bacterium]